MSVNQTSTSLITACPPHLLQPHIHNLNLIPTLTLVLLLVMHMPILTPMLVRVVEWNYPQQSSVHLQLTHFNLNSIDLTSFVMARVVIFPLTSSNQLLYQSRSTVSFGSSSQSHSTLSPSFSSAQLTITPMPTLILVSSFKPLSSSSRVQSSLFSPTQHAHHHLNFISLHPILNLEDVFSAPLRSQLIRPLTSKQSKNHQSVLPPPSWAVLGWPSSSSLSSMLSHSFRCWGLSLFSHPTFKKCIP